MASSGLRVAAATFGIALVAVVAMTTLAKAMRPDPLPAPFAVYQSSTGAELALYQSKGPCTHDAQLAIFTFPDREQVHGCWVANRQHPVIHLAFLDGDSANIPASVFQPPKGA